METALYIAILVISVVMSVLVILQSRGGGINRDASSIQRTRRGVEKTLYQATIALGVTFLLLALITSLPIFS
ncbi:MAG: preprotein translocase subunit SecG [Chloroflexus sp.]|nr:preprotein translocase subunit SecG [Chloroflexus sp.]MBO9314880.1 preprotein translocase subunit SecG [Chloroflexus sp.]MBO9317424.1 preprotein translocase subunit SecG [Chloroflexus sp.]MBO9373710.1 preprotein translocase subunit SecG [Chloroflexus sp.]